MKKVVNVANESGIELNNEVEAKEIADAAEPHDYKCPSYRPPRTQ